MTTQRDERRPRSGPNKGPDWVWVVEPPDEGGRPESPGPPGWRGRLESFNRSCLVARLLSG